MKKKPKFGASYSVFNGLELLETSLRSIRSSCDYINIVYSDESWYGEKSPAKVRPILEDLVSRGLADEILEYKVDPKIHPKSNEIKKRNVGMRAALHVGCDYLMSVDADECYIASELEMMKKEIIERGITHSYVCSLRYKSATEMYVPFGEMYPEYTQTFCKINRFSKFGGSKRKMVALVDPSRRISNRLQMQKHWMFMHIYQHHYLGYRKDIDGKFRNAALAMTPSANKTRRALWASQQTVKVENIFNLPIFKQRKIS